MRRAADLAHAAGALVFVTPVHYAPHALVDVARRSARTPRVLGLQLYGPHIGRPVGTASLVEELDAPKLEPAPAHSPSG